MITIKLIDGIDRNYLHVLSGKKLLECYQIKYKKTEFKRVDRLIKKYKKLGYLVSVTA